MRHSLFDIFQANLFPVVQLDHAVADVLDVVLLLAKDVKPGWVLGQRLLQLPGGQVDACHGDRFRHVANEDVGAETVIHEVPKEGGETGYYNCDCC